MKEAKKLGLWAIKQEWEGVDPQSVTTFSEYLDLVRLDDVRT